MDNSSVLLWCLSRFQWIVKKQAKQYRHIPVNCLQFVCTHFDNLIMSFKLLHHNDS